MRIAKTLLIFLLGGATGAGVTYLLLNDKYTKRAEEAEEEISDVRDFYRQKLYPEEFVDGVTVTEDDPINKDKKDYNKIVKKYVTPVGDIPSIITPWKQAIITPEQMMHPTDDIPDPYVISEEEFSEEFFQHEKVTLTYYIDDDTLMDTDESVIDDVTGLIGDDAFEDIVEEDSVFVRNEKLGIDYEILRVKDSYACAILGYARPTKKKGSKKGMKHKDEDSDD